MVSASEFQSTVRSEGGSFEALSLQSVVFFTYRRNLTPHFPFLPRAHSFASRLTLIMDVNLTKHFISYLLKKLNNLTPFKV